MCPADIIPIGGKGRPALSEGDPGQFVQAINELAEQWAAWRVPQPNVHAPQKQPRAEIIPFPLKETLDEQRATFLSLIDRLRPDQLELLSLIGRAFQPEVTEKVPDSPDSELIRQCNRMNTLETALAAVCEEIPDGEEKANVVGLLSDKWFEARLRIFQLDGPRTLEGARAAALALLALHPGGVDDAIQDADLPTWLACQLARFVIET